MFRIAFVNLPFAACHIPSIGMTQLEAVVRDTFADRVKIDLCYVNHDVAGYLSFELYEELRTSGHHLQAGFPEWFFRDAAFPELGDNSAEYFARFYPGRGEQGRGFRQRILELRRGIGGVLDAAIEKYALADVDLVGFTSMFFENNAAFALSRRLKALNPKLLTTLGGANCESPAGEEFARRIDAVDFVFSGPALKSFPRFLGNLLDGDPDDNHKIHGVFSSKNTAADPAGGPGATQAVGVGVMGEALNINQPIELDYSPFLAALRENFPHLELSAVLPFETSRGCWWGEHSHCTFCGLNKSTMVYKAMDGERARELISSLFEYDDRTSAYLCVDNILQRNYIQEVFPKLDPPEGATIFYQLKANLSEKEMATMAESRVNAITPGFESLSTSTLKLMAKGVSAFHNLEVMKYCRMYDIWPGWNLLIGSPGEMEDVYEKYVEDLPRFVHLPPPQGLFSIRFNRYSPYFMYPEKYGLKLEPIDYYQMVYPFPEGALENIAYDFRDANGEAEYLRAMARWIDRVRERVESWNARWAGEDPESWPQLYLHEAEDGTRIYDSRSGEVEEVPIGELETAILGRLGKRHRAEALHKEMAPVAPEDLARALAWLEERGLLFREDEYVMSLVLPRRPPPMTHRANILRPVVKTRAEAPRIERATRRVRRRKRTRVA